MCLLNFIRFGLRVTKNFTMVFDNEIMHKYFVYSFFFCFCFCFIFQSCPFVFKSSFYQQGKSKLCRFVFLYVVVLAEQ